MACLAAADHAALIPSPAAAPSAAPRRRPRMTGCARRRTGVAQVLPWPPWHWPARPMRPAGRGGHRASCPELPAHAGAVVSLSSGAAAETRPPPVFREPPSWPAMGLLPRIRQYARMRILTRCLPSSRIVTNAAKSPRFWKTPMRQMPRFIT